MHVSSVSPPCLFSLIAFEVRCIGRVLSVLGSRLKNEVYTQYTFHCVSPPCLFSLMDFEIWCIGRVLFKFLKNEVYIRIHTCFPAFIFGFCFHCMLYMRMFVGMKMQAVTFTIIRCNYCRMETLLVRSWIKLSVRRIERIEKLARVIVINEMQLSDGEHNISDQALYFPFVESNKWKLFLSGGK